MRPAQIGNTNGASSNLMITKAERRFPCRIKLDVPDRRARRAAYRDARLA
jgi:hypothetical protein